MDHLVKMFFLNMMDVSRMISYIRLDLQIREKRDRRLSNMNSMLIVKCVRSSVDQNFPSGFFKILERLFSLREKYFSIQMSMSVNQHHRFQGKLSR